MEMMWYEYMEKIYEQLFLIDEHLLFIHNDINTIKNLFTIAVTFFIIDRVRLWTKEYKEK